MLQRPSESHTFLTYCICICIARQPPGSNYFRRPSSSALTSHSSFGRVILRDRPAAAHDPSHHQHAHKPERLVLGRCITALPFSRHEPDPVLPRLRPFARLAPTHPVTQSPQWHSYNFKTPSDTHQRPFLPKFLFHHGLHSGIHCFQNLDGCQ